MKKIQTQIIGFTGKQLEEELKKAIKISNDCYEQHVKNVEAIVGIVRGNGDEVLTESNTKPKYRVSLTLEQWIWLNKLIGETQGTLTSIAMQSTDEEHKHFIKPCIALDKDWDLFIAKMREDLE